MSTIKTPALVALLATLSACTVPFGNAPATESGGTVSQAISSASIAETSNVTYEGTLEPAGVTIYMEGTHKLTLTDGRTVMLVSSSVDLNQYVGHHVSVFGSVKPTVEAGGIIMTVQAITDLSPNSSSESSSSSLMSSSESSSMSASSVSSVANATSQSTHSAVAAAVSSAAQSSAATSVVMSSAASMSTYEASPQLTDAANTMTKDNMSAPLWTQQYCSKTAGFCVPIHKNWYYQSFGATASTLWHVEVGPQTINNIGDGPLVINLVAGAIDSIGETDGQVKLANDSVIGYRAWTENRHIEIIAPANLQAAVSYMTANLKASQ